MASFSEDEENFNDEGTDDDNTTNEEEEGDDADDNNTNKTMIARTMIAMMESWLYPHPHPMRWN